jgi:hypothetical protein
MMFRYCEPLPQILSGAKDRFSGRAPCVEMPAYGGKSAALACVLMCYFILSNDPGSPELHDLLNEVKCMNTTD